jgi:branched-chain amino acid transport system permease protein
MELLTTLVMNALHGLVYGMVLFLLASGLTLILGMMGVLNFAHGALYMLGAYVSFQVLAWTGQFWLSLVIAPVVVGCVGMFMERAFLRKVHSQGHASELLLTFGLAYVLEDIVKLIWGTEPMKVDIPRVLSGSVTILGSPFPVYRLFILLVAFLVFAFLFTILYKTRAGIIVRASVANKDMVDALGFDVPMVFLLLFGIGTWLAGLAGVVAGPYLITHPAMGGAILLDLFVVVVIGGMGSVNGALLSAFLIGELQSFGILILPQAAVVFEFLLMAVVLIVKPEGLLGEKS